MKLYCGVVLCFILCDGLGLRSQWWVEVVIMVGGVLRFGVVD